eukprot:g46275.t1
MAKFLLCSSKHFHAPLSEAPGSYYFKLLLPLSADTKIVSRPQSSRGSQHASLIYFSLLLTDTKCTSAQFILIRMIIKILWHPGNHYQCYHSYLIAFSALRLKVTDYGHTRPRHIFRASASFLRGVPVLNESHYENSNNDINAPGEPSSAATTASPTPPTAQALGLLLSGVLVLPPPPPGFQTLGTGTTTR